MTSIPRSMVFFRACMGFDERYRLVATALAFDPGCWTGPHSVALVIAIMQDSGLSRRCPGPIGHPVGTRQAAGYVRGDLEALASQTASMMLAAWPDVDNELHAVTISLSPRIEGRT